MMYPLVLDLAGDPIAVLENPSSATRNGPGRGALFSVQGNMSSEMMSLPLSITARISLANSTSESS